MKRLLFLFLLFTGIAAAQTSKTGRITTGTLANRPTCPSASAVAGDVYIATDQNPVVNATCDAANGWVAGGGGGTPSSPVNSLQKNNGGTFGSSNETDDGTNFSTGINTRFKGPNPWNDITLYGAMAGNPTQAPYSVGTTVNCTASNTTVGVGGTNFANLRNGEGVTLIGCGTQQSLAAPAAPTITNAISIGPTGTGYVEPGPAGSATKCYVDVYITSGYGLSAPSTEVCTTTSQTLGAASVTLTSASKADGTSNSTNTYVTSVAHGLPVGCTGVAPTGNCPSVSVYGTTDDKDFGGEFPVSSVADATHFTVVTGNKVANGAGASSTGGTVYWYNANHVKFATQSPPAGVIQHAIYCGASGLETLCGVSTPVNSGLVSANDLSYMTWDDFGATISGGGQYMAFLPNAVPVAAQADELTTTIVSGGGTSSLVLTAAPATSATGTTILHDDAPAFVAAYAAINNNNNGTAGAIYIPAIPTNTVAGAQCFKINSYVTFGGPINQSGCLALGGTVSFKPGGSTNPSNWYGTANPTASGYPATILVEGANPALYITGGKLDGLTFTSAGNSYVDIFAAVGGIPSWTLQNLRFTTLSNASDYNGVAVYQYGSNAPGSGQSGTILRNLYVQSGPGTSGAGKSTTPSILSKAFSEVWLDNIFLWNRTMFFTPNNVALQMEFDQHGAEDEGGNFCMVGTYNPASNLFFSGTLKNTVLDTMAHPLFCNFGGLSGPLTISNSNSPGSGVALVTGTPIGMLHVYNSGLNANQIGQNVNLDYQSQSSGGNYNAPLGMAGAALSMTNAPNPAISVTGPTGSYSTMQVNGNLVQTTNQSVADNFNRGPGAIGSNYTVTTGGFNVSSNTLVGTSSSNNAYWSATIIPSSLGLYDSVQVVNPTTSHAGPTFNLIGGGNYTCWETVGTGLQITKSGSVLATTTMTPAAGDVLYFTWTPGVNPDLSCTATSANGTVSTVTANDTTVTPTVIGLNSGSTTFTMDNFFGGPLHAFPQIDTEQYFPLPQHFSSVQTQSLSLNGSNNLLGVSGNSGTVAQSSGTLTNGNLAKFDASGNVVDSTLSAATIATAPSLIYNTASSAVNTNISATNMATSISALHDYLFNWTVSLTVVGAGCSGNTTVVVNEVHTDPNGGGAVTVPLGTITLANAGNGTVGFIASGTDNILAASGSTVQYSTSSYTAGSGCTTNPTYKLQPTLIQLW